MKISGVWIENTGTQALLFEMASAGYRAFFVGGCVRNAILGIPVSDIDIATDALPETVTKLAEKAGFRVIPTGIDHGTVTVLAKGTAHEVTTFRRDVRTDGRHAIVAFSTDLAEDAARRDFTMNALYADARGQVLDPLGGLPDVLARRVRFVGDAQARITEDYLRILRFFRFFAYYGAQDDGLDAEGLAACAGLCDHLSTLSRERVGAEMRKLLSAPNPAPAMGSMAISGVLAQVLAGADVRYLAPLVHLEADRPGRWMRRLCVIGGDNPTDRLRLSREESHGFSRIREAIGSLATPAALAWQIGGDSAADAIYCRAAILEQPLPQNWRADVARGVAANFPVTAADFMPKFHGPALGARLRHAQQRWLASDLTLTRAELIQ